ncbi:MAG: RsmE family RNA methyltransferase [Planctomycetota bacterium]|jgi:16S rRNA (uracil1498-N3)-methyltransferase
MELLRFYCNPIVEPVVELSASEARHLALVRRLVVGDEIELFDGLGTLAVGVIRTASSRKVTLDVRKTKVLPKPKRPQIVIAVSVAKGERFDWLIGKCTELGVDRISPVIFERTVKQAKNPRISERWNNLAIAAAKQCRRVFLPQIDRPVPLTEAVETLRKEHPECNFLLGSLSRSAQPLIDRESGSGDIVGLVGPEGGLTEQEEALLQSYGGQAVRLTDTVLRIETAAMAFAAILTARRNAQEKE